MFDYYEAIKHMYNGKVVKFVGFADSELPATKGTRFCMFRGCVHAITKDGFNRNGMVYNPNYRYELTDKRVSRGFWLVAC